MANSSAKSSSDDASPSTSWAFAPSDASPLVAQPAGTGASALRRDWVLSPAWACRPGHPLLGLLDFGADLGERLSPSRPLGRMATRGSLPFFGLETKSGPPPPPDWFAQLSAFFFSWR